MSKQHLAVASGNWYVCLYCGMGAGAPNWTDDCPKAPDTVTRDELSVRADALMQAAALRRKCWHCDSGPGHGCTSDIGDQGILPCYPHEDRVISGARDVIMELLEKMETL